MNIKNIAMVLLVASMASAFAQEKTSNSSVATVNVEKTTQLFLGPKNSISVCENDSLDKECRTATISKKLGDIVAIVAAPDMEGAIVSWFALSPKTVALCAFGTERDSDYITCTRLSKLSAALKFDTASATRPSDRLHKVSRLLPTELKRATSTLKARLANAVVATFRTLEECEDCDIEGGDEPGDGGGVDPDGDPVYGPSDPLPPGAAPGDPPQQIACYAAAYRAWLIMDKFCDSQSTASDRAICHDVKWKDYDEERQYCHSL